MAPSPPPRVPLQPPSFALRVLLTVLALCPSLCWAVHRTPHDESWFPPLPDPEEAQQQLLRMVRNQGLNWTELADPSHPLHLTLASGLWNLSKSAERDLPPSHPFRRQLAGPPPGKWALTVALTKMTQAKVYTQFLATLNFCGWRPFMEQYVQKVPVSIIACNDAAWRALPPKYQQQLRTNKVTARKFLQFHMIQQLWPYAAFLYWKNTSPYPTYLGPPAWRIADKKYVKFGNTKFAPVATQGVLVARDVSGLNLRLVVVQGMNRCLIPAGVFV